MKTIKRWCWWVFEPLLWPIGFVLVGAFMGLMCTEEFAREWWGKRPWVSNG